jgi:transcriptional regulator with XRE-family HTH domain
MDQQAIIAGIEERAKAVGLSMSEVCRRANIHPTTVSRWKESEKNPDPIGATLKSLSALEAVIAAEEARHPFPSRAAANGPDARAA